MSLSDDSFGMGGMFGDPCDELESSEDDSSCAPAAEFDYQTELPAFIIAALLAGLYELPPDWLLRTQTGLGRLVRYDSYRMVTPQWEPTSCHPSQFFSLCERALVPSTCPHTGQVRRFGLYRLQLPEATAEDLNQRLLRLAVQMQSEDREGVDVSNAAGGWHSQPTLFAHPDEAAQQLRESAVAAVTHVEGLSGQLAGCDNRDLQLDKVESWINISSCAGSWNRLHTHEGACWSVVYYAAAGGLQRGQLLIKPSPHLKDSTLPVMNSDDTARMVQLGDEGHTLVDGCGREKEKRLEEGVGEYLLVDPLPGMMLVFPSWLQHAVLPLHDLCVDRSNESTVEPRVSVACNFDLQK